MEKKVLQINHRTNPRYEMNKNKTKQKQDKSKQFTQEKYSSGWKEMEKKDNLHREIIQIK